MERHQRDAEQVRCTEWKRGKTYIEKCRLIETGRFKFEELVGNKPKLTAEKGFGI